MNSRGDRVASKLTVLATGRQSIQVVNPVPGETYVVGIRGRSDAAVKTGNYVLTVDVATVVADMVPLFGGVARLGEKDYSLLTSAKSQLFRIDLSTVATVGQASQVTLVDVRTQSVVQTIVAIGGTSSTAFVWLQEGDYVIVATALSQDAANVNPVSYQVTAAVVSDDEGPLTDGSTGSTGDSTSGDTFVWNDIPVDESPLVEDDIILNDTWINPLVLVLAERFYDEFFGP
jgi:translation initiation factor IF-1